MNRYDRIRSMLDHLGDINNSAQADPSKEAQEQVTELEERLIDLVHKVTGLPISDILDTLIEAGLTN